MKRSRIAPTERILGVLLGVLLALTFFLVGVINVSGSQSFYLGQDKRYVITYRMGLKNTDQFRDVYHSLQAAIRGQEPFNRTLYRTVPESLVTLSARGPVTSRWVVLARGETLWSDSEEAYLQKVGTAVSYARRIALACYLPLAALLIWCLHKRGRLALLGIGWYSVFASVLTAALLNIFLAWFSTQTSLLSPLSGGFWLRVVFSPQTQSDLLTGIQWFYDFLMLIPLGVGTVLIKSSVKKTDDPDEDYLYQ